MKQTAILQNVATERAHEIPSLVRTSVLASQAKLKVAVTAVCVTVGLMQLDARIADVRIDLGAHPAEVFVSKADSEEVAVAVYEGMEPGQATAQAIEVSWQGHTAWLNVQLAVRADLENAQLMVSVRRLSVIAVAMHGQRVEVGSQEGAAVLAIFGNMKLRYCNITVCEF